MSYISASTGGNEQSGIGYNTVTNDRLRYTVLSNNIERTKQKVIITNIRESTANSVEEYKKQDMQSFVKLYMTPSSKQISCVKLFSDQQET